MKKIFTLCCSLLALGYINSCSVRDSGAMYESINLSASFDRTDSTGDYVYKYRVYTGEDSTYKQEDLRFDMFFHFLLVLNNFDIIPQVYAYQPGSGSHKILEKIASIELITIDTFNNQYPPLSDITHLIKFDKYGSMKEYVTFLNVEYVSDGFGYSSGSFVFSERMENSKNQIRLQPKMTLTNGSVIVGSVFKLNVY